MLGREEAQVSKAVIASSHEDERKKRGRATRTGRRMEKKLILKSDVVEFSSSAGSRQEGVSKRARHLSPTGEGVMFVAEVSPPALA